MEVFGRYQLLRRLGHGGMAEVFLARLASGDAAKYLAIKRLLRNFSDRPRVVRRLANEARLTVWLTHPNIVQVFDFGRVGEHYFIAMEYVDGCDLRSVIRPRGHTEQGCQLPIEVALDIAFQLADALRYAHRCTDGEGQPLGIIHRDISPHNVLISRDGHPKLADFGVARAAISDDLSRPGALLGKLSYMPPEQAKGLPYDARVDLYACGAVLYEMLVGGRPFGESSRLAAASERLPPPPSTLRPSLPPELDALVLRAMAPQPGDRFQAAEEFCEALARQLEAFGGRPKPHQLAGLVSEALTKQATPPEEPLSGMDAYEPGEDSLIEPEVTAVRHFMILPKAAGDAARQPRFLDSDTLPGQLPGPLKEPPTGTYELPPALRSEPPSAAQKLSRQLAGAPTAPLTVPAEVPHLLPPQPTPVARGVVAEPPGVFRTFGQRALGAGQTLWRSTSQLLLENWQAAALGAGALVLFALGFSVGRLTAPKAVVLRTPRRPAALVTVSAVDAGAAALPRRGTVRVSLRHPDAAVLTPSPDAGPKRSRRAARRAKPRPAKEPARQVTKAPDKSPSKPLSKRQQQWLRDHLLRAYGRGDYRVAQQTALRLLQHLPRDPSSLSLFGASSCRLGQRWRARAAASRLSRGRRQMLKDFCRKQGIHW